MPQDTKPDSSGAAGAPDADDDEHYHYYSGGEIKELAGTRVPPALWVFWVVLVIICLFAIVFAGALGPGLGVSHIKVAGTEIGNFKPIHGSHAQLTAIEEELVETHGFSAANTLDMTRIPLPAGETLDQAVSKGSDVYQNYCIGCHGPNQDGNGVNSASLNPKPRNLHDAPFMQALSYQRIYTSVHKGVPGTAMPRWENTLSEDQMKNAIAYVLSLTAPPVSQAQIADAPQQTIADDVPAAATMLSAPSAPTGPAPSTSTNPPAPAALQQKMPADAHTHPMIPATPAAGSQPQGDARHPM